MELKEIAFIVTQRMRGLLLLAFLICIGRIDKREKKIPNMLLRRMGSCNLILQIAEILLYQGNQSSLFLAALGGFFLAGSFFVLVYRVTGGAIGAGDVKLFAVLGFALGKNTILWAMFFTLFYAGMDCLWQLPGKKGEVREEVPLGPFVLPGVFTVMMLGL